MSASSSNPRVITFVTGNANKLREMNQILADQVNSSNFTLQSKDLDLPELQGDPNEVAIEKCKMAAKHVDGPVMVEDVSLCFNALNGLPGVYIKWFLRYVGHEGLNKMLDGFDDRSAYAQCTIAYSDGGDSEIHVFAGRTKGMIVRARGDKHFGWDSVFEVRDDACRGTEHFGKTYAELDAAVKNTLSHRSRAYAKFHEFISTHFKNCSREI